MNRIVSNPKILGGKPVIKGNRLSIDFILNLFASGASEKGILEDYQYIKIEDIHAYLTFPDNTLKYDISLELECAK
jgi:uncharacterized protein (DUF433 family)